MRTQIILVAWVLMGLLLAGEVEARPKNYLTFDNQTNMRATVRVFRAESGTGRRQPVAELTVESGEAVTTRIGNGDYYHVTRFQRGSSVSYLKSEDFDIYAPSDAYARVSITLHGVDGGTLSTESVGQDVYNGAAR